MYAIPASALSLAKPKLNWEEVRCLDAFFSCDRTEPTSKGVVGDSRPGLIDSRS